MLDAHNRGWEALAVLFAENEEAKRLGARWDPERRLWYAPASLGEQRVAALVGRWPLWVSGQVDLPARTATSWIPVA